MNKVKNIIKKDYPKVEGEEQISKAVSHMNDYEGIIVLEDGKYAGILNKRDISRAKISPKAKVKTFVKNVAKISGKEDLAKTAAYMLESDSYILPVFEKDKIIGIVTAKDVLKKAVEKEFGEEKIEKYISKPVIKIDADDPVSKAIRIFKEEDISRLPVFENNNLSGIITLDDTLSKFIHPEHRQGGSGQYDDTSKYGAYMADKKESIDLPIRGMMSSTYQLMEPDRKVKDVVNQMFEKDYRGMMIGKGDIIQGIVTKRDLLEPLATSMITEPIVIQFSGKLDQIKDFNKIRPKEIIYNQFKKYLDFLDNAYVYVRLKQHTEQSKGKHIIYCKMRLSSPRDMYVASEEGWGYLDAINKSIEAIEKQIKKDMGR